MIADAAFELVPAIDMDVVRALFREYQQELGVDLCFQGFDAELAGLPGDYAPPRGRLILATGAGRVAGCVALRPLGDGACEMKRLYVRPSGRGHGLGRVLAQTLIAAARDLGYQRMLLDTTPSMTSAQDLYASLGFTRTTPYRYNPIDGATFWQLNL